MRNVTYINKILTGYSHRRRAIITIPIVTIIIFIINIIIITIIIILGMIVNSQRAYYFTSSRGLITAP